MNTQEIADKLVAYNREGKFPDVYTDLYADDFVSIEMPGLPNEVCKGHAEVMKKGEWWEETFEVFSVDVSDPLVAEGWFAVNFKMHTKEKATGKEAKESELGVYKVEDGKIVQEQFFYNVDM